MKRKHYEALVEVLRKRRPFRAFTVELFGGQRLEIDYPMALDMIGGIVRFVAPGNVSVFYDHESVLRVIDAPSQTIV